MIGFTAEVKGERQFFVHLDALPIALRVRLLPIVTNFTNLLLAAVRAAEPSRTGTLRSVTHSFIDQSAYKIRGGVRIDARPGSGLSHNVAAAALEYGAHRPFTVRAHEQSISHLFGRSIERRSVMVAAYRRRPNIAAQRFLRGPFDSLKPLAQAEIFRVIQQMKLDR